MPSLLEHVNVDNTVLNILKQKGFSIWYDKDKERFCAEKNGWDFMADSPCGLLGMVAIYEWKRPEVYSEYWWRISEPDLTDNLSEKPPEYKSVCEIKRL